MSTISVVIPTYNRRDSLARALDSVINQSRVAEEIIVIDDGSNDATASMVQTNYPAVTLLKQENQGVSAARNSGIKHAKGEWLALLDSDDCWHARKLEKQLDALDKQPEYRVAHTEEIWIRNGVRVNQMKKHQKYGGYIFRRCLPLCAISPSSSIIHRSVFSEVGLFDESLPVCEDYDMWLRISARYPVLFIDEALITKYGGHADQLSRRFWGMDRFRIRALEKILDENILGPEETKATVDSLLEKIDIYLAGAKKHNNTDSVDYMSGLLRRYQTASPLRQSQS